MKKAVLFLLVTILSSGSDDKKQDNENPHTDEFYMGKKVVVDRDTLTIVNHSGWTTDLYLSDGTEVSRSFVDKAIIIENKK